MTKLPLALSAQKVPADVVAIVPAFNCVATLPSVVTGLAAHGLAILVIDDGSTDETASWLQHWCESVEEGSRPARHVLVHSRNLGKAAALRSAFAEALRLGFGRALTVDADGQHDPADAPLLLAASQASEGATLVRGRRDDQTPGYPKKRRLARRLNDLAIRAQTGASITDSPCGYRVYPLDESMRIRCLSGRYAWEEEFITRAAWAGMRIVEAPVACRYFRHGESQSHYKFARDWPEGVAINLWLLLRAALPMPRAWRRLGRASPRALSDRLSRWLGVCLLRGDLLDRWHFVGSLVVGSLIAFAPLPDAFPSWGRILLAIWLSWRWHGSLWAFAGPCAAMAALQGAS